MALTSLKVLFKTYIFQKPNQQMQDNKQIEQKIFSQIVDLQKFEFTSKATFVLSSILKLCSKEIYVLIIFLLKIQSLVSFTRSMLLSIENSLQISSFCLIGFIAGLFAIYIRRKQQGKNFRKITQLLLPFIDILAFPVITVSAIFILKSENLIYKILGLISSIGISFFSLSFNLLLCSNIPKTQNLFQFKEAKNVMVSYVLELILCIFLSVSRIKGTVLQPQELVFYCALKFLFVAMKFKQKALRRFYIHPFSQKVSAFFFILELNLAFIALIIGLLHIDVLRSNLVWVMAVMTLLAFLGLSHYTQHRDVQLFLSSALEVRGVEQAFLYIDCLGELARKIENEEQDIILVSLRTKHRLICADSQCFCRGQTKSLKNFIERYVKCELQVLAQRFESSVSVLLSVLYFKMVVFKFYPEILSKLQVLETKFSFSIFERFQKFSITNYVQSYIKSRNLNIKAIESQAMFKLQALNVEMRELINIEIELRQKKWRYLSHGICQVDQLEIYCQKQLQSIKRIKEIQQNYAYQFKKSLQFNLLILFYLTKISFLGNGSDLAQNLKELNNRQKLIKIQSIKQLNKFIYHKKSCAIQTKIDTKVMGIITAASRNVEEMFGFPNQEVIGKSINSLMPEIMQLEHDAIMLDWAKTGTWRTIGKLKEVFCIHREQYCFSALLYLKIYVKETGLHFITNIFKLNDSDNLLINPQGCIEGIGRRFLKILGQPAMRMPLKLLIKNKDRTIQRQNYEEGKVYRRIFISLKEAKSQVENYLVSNLLVKQNTGKRDEAFAMSLQEQNHSKYFITFRAKYANLGRISFCILELIQAFQIQKCKTDYFLAITSNYVGSLKSTNYVIDNFNTIEQDFIQESSFAIRDCTGSLHSLNQRDNYPVSKIKEKFSHLLQKPQDLKDKRMKSQTKALVILAALICTLNFLSYYIYKSLLQQINQIYVAAGSVSDIMQTTQIAYDHIYNLKAQLSQKSLSEFDSQLKSTQYLQNYIYGLRQISFRRLMTDKTNFRKVLFYLFYKDPSSWQINQNNLPINTDQFFRHMYYLTGHLVQQLAELRRLNKTGVPLSYDDFNYNYLQMLIKNFPQMKRINQFQLVNYEALEVVSFNFLNIISLCSIAIQLALTIAAAILIDNYYRFRFHQLEKSFKFFSLIPLEFIEILKQYYVSLQKMVTDLKNNDKRSQIEEKFYEVDTGHLFQKFKEKLSVNLRLTITNYKTYYKWIFIIFALITINLSSYLVTASMRDFFPPAKSAIVLINELMRKENRFIESYLDIKAAYYAEPSQLITNQFIDQIKLHLENSILNWNQVAVTVSFSLTSYDSSFHQKFKKSLINGICELSSKDLPESQNKKCIEELNYKILQKGVMASMNYFQVAVQGALEEMRAQYATKKMPISAQNYFRHQDFVQLDKMQIYLFKIYQLTQFICYNSTTEIIKQITNTFLISSVGFAFFYLVMLILWFLATRKQKRKLSKLYGHLLLVPFNILKSNMRIVNTIKQSVQYQQE